VGFVGNINYAQMIDLAAGFVGLDPCADDGYRFGLWPWERKEGLQVSEQAVSLRKDIFQMDSTPKPGAKPAAEKGGAYWGRGHSPTPPVEGETPSKAPSEAPSKAPSETPSKAPVTDNTDVRRFP